MKLSFRSILLLALPVAVALVSGCVGPTGAGSTRLVSLSPTHRAVPENRLTALDRYVAKPDPAFAWHVVTNTTLPGGVTVSALSLTSQTWLTTNQVDRTVWRHWLSVYRPAAVENKTALLFLAGGNHRDNQPPRPSGELAQIAAATKSVVAELKQVPNQPLVFVGDGKQREEDEILAFGWARYLKTGEEKWIGRLPMTKSAVRAMDAITAFCATPGGGNLPVETFMVAGGSKRGWTTWATAEVDRRVVAIAPIVIDLLNMEPSFRHHWRAYGFWAPAVGDYVAEGVMDWQGTPEYHALLKIEDPFEYRDRLTLPKLILNACGDQFFLPDSAQFYFDQLKGPKYLRYVPNADHSLKGSDAYETLAAWHYLVANQKTAPRFVWQHPSPGQVQLMFTDLPKAVKLWQATNPNARDFRLETLGPKWTSTDLTPDAKDPLVVAVPAPPTGWTAYLVESTFDVCGPRPLKLTTDVRVVPDTYPFPPLKTAPHRGFLTR